MLRLKGLKALGVFFFYVLERGGRLKEGSVYLLFIVFYCVCLLSFILSCQLN